MQVDHDAEPPPSWRLVLILGSTVLFGLLLERAGVLIALPCLIVVAALASRNSRIDATSLAAGFGVVAFCVVVFVEDLGVPMPLIGSWFGR